MEQFPDKEEFLVVIKQEKNTDISEMYKVSNGENVTVKHSQKHHSKLESATRMKKTKKRCANSKTIDHPVKDPYGIKIKMYKCVMCKFSTDKEKLIIEHLQKNFSDIDASFTCASGFQCCHCTFWTLLESAMKNHLLQESCNKKRFFSFVNFKYPQSYVCDICGMKFESLQIFDFHRDYAHWHGSECLLCGEKLPDFKKLLWHLKSHNK